MTTEASGVDLAKIRGYGDHAGAAALSAEEITLGTKDFASRSVTPQRIAALAGPDPILRIEDLHAGYGAMEILHGIDLRVGDGQSLCLIGPNGSGKSTVLNSICGLADVRGGRIEVRGHDMRRLSPARRLREAGVAYVLQDSSVFPDMTVEENLWMGGTCMDSTVLARRATDSVFDRYPRLAARRDQPARVLSGGERRLLEISRALMMEPRVLLIDEPSIGLEPRFIDLVFEVLNRLQRHERKTIVMVEQNALKGLQFADVGYVLVAGVVAMAAPGRELLEDPTVGRLFLGG